ncbi:MAG: spore maturation protein [Lachnospiraceae bacterium]|nr:spore maturation protein [Lachnospiraceae bacterium]
MKFLFYLSELILPFVVFYIIGYGMAAKVPVYDSFIKGAGNGLKTVVKLAPTLIGLTTATGVLRSSGFLDLAAGAISRIIPNEIFPSALVPLGTVKLFSSSAATGLLLDIYRQYGTDSLTGLTASLMLSSTETVFYTMGVYFQNSSHAPAHSNKKTRYTLCGALFSTLAGIIACALLARLMI